MKKRNFKRLFIGSDSHCGHRVGLTPPEYQSRGGFGKWEGTQATLWNFFLDRVSFWKPFDVAILNGDLVDGKGFRSGGSELITADRMKQAEIAYKAFREINAKKYRIIAGTPYHSGMDEDFEIKCNDEFIKNGCDCTFQGVGFFNINGWEIDVKHKIASSSVHHGRATPLLKEIDANTFWYLADVEPNADIIIRSHVHKSLQTFQDDKYGFITPALQGLGDKYGSRQCSNVVEFGFIVLDLPEKSSGEPPRWKIEKIKGIQQRTESEIL